MTIGDEKGLSGFRKNRYAGSSSFYSSIEFRIKLMDVDSYILPGQLGFTLFGNIGRVHYPQDSRKWHPAFGAGFYYLPFNMFAITGSVGFNGNEKMVAFSLGAKFNVTY
jgi:hemolysin activation/secretion protein